jgi:hypothetical protein
VAVWIVQRCNGDGGDQLAIACQSSVFRRHLNEALVELGKRRVAQGEGANSRPRDGGVTLNREISAPFPCRITAKVRYPNPFRREVRIPASHQVLACAESYANRAALGPRTATTGLAGVSVTLPGSRRKERPAPRGYHRGEAADGPTGGMGRDAEEIVAQAREMSGAAPIYPPPGGAYQWPP